MNIDEILSTSVEDLARGVTPPPPNPEGIRARARTARRRQWVATAAGTAAVVVGGVAITSGLPDQGSTPPVDDPRPTPSTAVLANGSVIWSEARALHFGSRQVPAPDGIFGFGLLDGAVVYTTSDREAKVFFQSSDRGNAVQIGDNAQLAPVGDPTSGLAAWFEAEGRAGSLVVYDTARGEEVARTSVPPALHPQDNIIFPGFSPVISVSSTAVYYHGPDNKVWLYRWPAGGEPESTGKSNDELFDVAGEVTARAGSEKGSVEFVTSAGTVVATDLPSGGHLSPGGTMFAAVDMKERGMPGIKVADTRSGESTKLDLFGSGGEPGLLFGVGWSDRDTLMVKNIVSDESSGIRLPGQMIACTVTTGECDVVATMKQAFFVTVPLS